MATELQQLGTFLGAKFDDIYDGVIAVGDAAKVNGQTADQIKSAVLNTLRDGVTQDGDSLFKLRQMISALQSLVTSDDISLDTVQEIVGFIKNNQSLIDSISTLKANVADVYTKLESDDMINLKANSADVYLKTQTYTKSEVDAKDSLKADTTYVNGELATKVKLSDVLGTISAVNKVVTQGDVDTAIAGKADTIYVNTELAKKATIVYTDAELAKKSDITYTDSQDALKVNISDVDGTISAGNKVTTQSVVDGSISTAIAPKANKTEVDADLATKVSYSDTISPVTVDNKVVTASELNTGLDLKADKSVTYTKTEVDAKESALNTKDGQLQTQINQIGTYSDFVLAFEATLV